MATKPTPKKKTTPTRGEATKNDSVVRALLRNVVLAVSLLVIVLVVVSVLLGIFPRHGQNKDVPNFIGSTIVDAERMAHKGKELTIFLCYGYGVLL
mgnify:CR=1 FL=1